ncbi:MAG: N-acetylmuramoyl-L-alanine amidase [Melioribacteraceae bacterium]|nr:N-acetylmuramoyl-L-alanine amidase [Melioribacteraceae bacterium]
MALNFNLDLKFTDDQYFPTKEKKSGICIHHTVGGSAQSSFQWWLNDGNIVGTAFIIARDGTIHKIFDPASWAWQFGLKWPNEKKLKFEKRFIGIEIASEGGLTESGGKLYCFDRISDKTEKSFSEAFDFGTSYRGYRYFDMYEDAQIESVINLINELCTDFNIAKKIPGKPLEYYGNLLENFEGIIGHAMVRKDKSDPIPNISFYNRVIAGCNLNKIDISNDGREDMSPAQIEQLFSENKEQFIIMNRAAGNLVKSLLWELQDDNRETYIRLKNAVPDGHIVNYEMVKGNDGLVKLAAESLGFKSWDNNKLEVHSA